MKIYTDNGFYINWIEGATRAANIKEADIVMFTGGSDVTPAYYGEQKGKFTTCDAIRDEIELEMFDLAKRADKPMIGICRGSQFLCMASGGTIIQHVNNHAINGLHPMKTNDGRVFHTTSTHHQMMYPYSLLDSDYEILAYAEALSTTYLDGENNEKVINNPQGKLVTIKSFHSFREPEVVLFQEHRLGIQGHPEFQNMPKDTKIYLNSLIKDKLLERNKTKIYL